MPDLQVRFAAHLAASLKRDAWARKGLQWQQAGKINQAREALRKCQYWDWKRRLLEP